MHSRKIVFYQITDLLKRQSNRIANRFNDRIQSRSFTHWNHLCLLIFALLSGNATLGELVDIIQTHSKHSYNLGFGFFTHCRSVVSMHNTLRDYKIYEEIAIYMVSQAQKRRRITKEFELHGRFYVVGPTTISSVRPSLDELHSKAHNPATQYTHICLIDSLNITIKLGRQIVEITSILRHSLLV